MSVDTDIKAASLWLFYRRNPAATRADARAEFGWSEGDTTRRHGDLNAPSDRLAAWIKAMELGRLPWNDDGHLPKVWWFNHIQDLMMIGTPPWMPHDYVDVTPSLLVVVPRGATIQEECPRELSVSFERSVPNDG